MDIRTRCKEAPRYFAKRATRDPSGELLYRREEKRRCSQYNINNCERRTPRPSLRLRLVCATRYYIYFRLEVHRRMRVLRIALRTASWCVTKIMPRLRISSVCDGQLPYPREKRDIVICCSASFCLYLFLAPHRLPFAPKGHVSPPPT